MDSELYKPFKLGFSLFKAVGMWQDGNQSWAYFFYGYLLHFVFIDFYIVSQFIYAFNAEGLRDFVESIGYCTTYVATVFKCFNFFYKLKNIKKNLESLEKLLVLSFSQNFASRDHVKTQVKFALKVYKMFWFSAYFTCFTGIFVPILSHRAPYKVWFPFDTDYGTVGFWLSSYYLVFNSFVVSATDISLDILPVIFISFAIGLINELADRLRHVGDNLELKNCIEVHGSLRKYIQEIEKNFSTTILVQGLMSSVILCTSAFTMSTESDPSAFARVLTFMIPMVLLIFLPCYFGNELSLASAKLPNALFHSSWVNGDIKMMNSVKIFMENTKKEMKISAFGVFNANLETFTGIMNSAYSLFAVLKRVNN